MKVLFIGDIYGSLGRTAVKEVVPILKDKYQPDFIIANGENAASGRGINANIANDLFTSGIDALTMGNHTWDNKEIFQFIDKETRILRPANFPNGTPGIGFTVLHKHKKQLAILNLQGRTFLPPLACPFETLDHILTELDDKHKCILLDFHAEATSEKVAMGWYADGKLSALLGTHTHVQTHDERILPGGTAYVTDVGMTGPSDGVLGVDREAVIRKFRTQLPVRFTPAKGMWQFNGSLITIDESTGKATAIKLLRIYEKDLMFLA